MHGSINKMNEKDYLEFISFAFAFIQIIKGKVLRDHLTDLDGHFLGHFSSGHSSVEEQNDDDDNKEDNGESNNSASIKSVDDDSIREMFVAKFSRGLKTFASSSKNSNRITKSSL